jgi:hypothetical protein
MGDYQSVRRLGIELSTFSCTGVMYSYSISFSALRMPASSLLVRLLNGIALASFSEEVEYTAVMTEESGVSRRVRRWKDGA